MTSPLSTSTAVPAGAVLISAIGAQLADNAVFFLLPPLGVLAPLSGLLAILLTAGAARFVTRGRRGAVVARTGLALGLTSAAIGPSLRCTSSMSQPRTVSLVSICG